MTTYTAHVYRDMLMTFDGINADSPAVAAAKACDLATEDAVSLDDCDGETFTALVDVAGDEDYRHSRTIDFEPERSRKAGRAAVLLLDLIHHGALTLRDGDAEFKDTIFAFDSQCPDWSALAEAIGHDTAAAAWQKAMQHERQ